MTTTIQQPSAKHLNMLMQIKILRSHKGNFVSLNKDIQDYLKVKNTENISRTKLVEVIIRKRKEKTVLLSQAKFDFPTVDWMEFYNGVPL